MVCISVKKSNLLTPAAIFLIIALLLMCDSLNRVTEEAILVKAFNTTGAKFHRLTINDWRRVTIPSGQKNDITFFDSQVKKIFPVDRLPLYKIEKSNKLNTIEAQGILQHGVLARITLSFVSPPANTTKHEGYLITSFTSQNSIKPAYYINRFFTGMMENQQSHKSVIISGFIDSKLESWQTNNIIGKAAEVLSIQNMDVSQEGQLVSITGYSSHIQSILTVEKKSVNINMALRYNSVENRTMVYIGTPLITSEY